jgi:hypothetical protein
MAKMKQTGGTEFYQTFDSGNGPVVPKGMESDFAHQDSDDGLNNYCLNQPDIDGLHGAVPEVPLRKK